MNKTINFSIFFALILVMFSGLVSCDKSEPLTIPPSRASFLGASSDTYYVLDDPNSYYAIRVGFTTVSNQDRTINFSITPSADAKEGQDYVIPSMSVTIPAGQLIDSLIINGKFDGFADDHVDTLTFAISSASNAEGLSGDSTFTLIVNKLCPYDVNNFSGKMKVITDEWEDYKTGDIIPVTLVDENHVSFEYNAYDAQPIVITIDPDNRMTTVPKQPYGNYGTPPDWPYGTISAQSVAGSADNYIDLCGKIISVRLEHTVSAGTFNDHVIKLQKVGMII